MKLTALLPSGSSSLWLCVHFSTNHHLSTGSLSSICSVVVHCRLQLLLPYVLLVFIAPSFTINVHCLSILFIIVFFFYLPSLSLPRPLIGGWYLFTPLIHQHRVALKAGSQINKMPERMDLFKSPLQPGEIREIFFLMDDALKSHTWWPWATNKDLNATQPLLKRETAVRLRTWRCPHVWRRKPVVLRR